MKDQLRQRTCPGYHRQYSAWQLLELLAVSSFVEQGCQSPDLIDMPRVHLARISFIVVSSMKHFSRAKGSESMSISFSTLSASSSESDITSFLFLFLSATFQTFGSPNQGGNYSKEDDMQFRVKGGPQLTYLKVDLQMGVASWDLGGDWFGSGMGWLISLVHAGTFTLSLCCYHAQCRQQWHYFEYPISLQKPGSGIVGPIALPNWIPSTRCGSLCCGYWLLPDRGFQYSVLMHHQWWNYGWRTQLGKSGVGIAESSKLTWTKVSI
ncbi:hypothetical protein Tco_0089791 [Tanacetum coccineum]